MAVEASEPPAAPEASDDSPGNHEPHSLEVATPPSFPKKRRGRPPGRPNTTVKESDYEEDARVQRWNAARVENPIPAVAVNIREALPESSMSRDHQREIYRLPSVEFIYFVQGWITSRHIASQRPSYVNGLLIHSRGQDSQTSCTQCVEKRSKNALGPFLTCRVLPGFFRNSCSNCKWFDTTSSCSLFNGPKPNRKRKGKDMQTVTDMEKNDSQAFVQKDAAVSPSAEGTGEAVAQMLTAGKGLADASAVDSALSQEKDDRQDMHETIAHPIGL